MTEAAAITLAGLLARARKGLANPGSLDEAARGVLIADIIAAEKQIADAPHIETGRYCVLGTGHITLATADLLEHWSSERAQDRLLDIAGCIHGWFVPTREVDPETLALLPADLLAVMQFARGHGFHYVLFDCDAGTVEALAVHSW